MQCTAFDTGAPARLTAFARRAAAAGRPLFLSAVVLGLAVAWLSLAGGLDVALIQDDEREIGTRLHRFVRVEGDGRVVTKGDANFSEDSPATPAQVLGRTRLVVPSIGLPLVWLKHVALLPLFAACAGTWLALVVVLHRQSASPRTGHRKSAG
jgi:hypothetical protein